MSQLIQLLIRHGLALLGGYFAAHHIEGDTTTGIIVGLIFVVIPVIWSTVAKWLHLDDKLAEGISSSQQWRVLIGSIVSQGITALSAYLAIDANKPELLGGVLVNAALSKAGLYQAAVGTKDAIKAFALGSMLLMSSCATTAAFLASPFGQATIQTADQLAKQVLVTTETLGLQQIVLQASAKLAALKAQAPESDVAKEALRIGQIAGYAGVIEAAQVKYEQLTGKRYSAPKVDAKQPVKVTPSVTMQAPACLIPDYGVRVAAQLAAN